MTDAENLASRELRTQRVQMTVLGVLAGVASLFAHSERSLFATERPGTGFVAVGTPAGGAGEALEPPSVAVFGTPGGGPLLPRGGAGRRLPTVDYAPQQAAGTPGIGPGVAGAAPFAAPGGPDLAAVTPGDTPFAFDGNNGGGGGGGGGNGFPFPGGVPGGGGGLGSIPGTGTAVVPPIVEATPTPTPTTAPTPTPTVSPTATPSPTPTATPTVPTPTPTPTPTTTPTTVPTPQPTQTPVVEPTPTPVPTTSPTPVVPVTPPTPAPPPVSAVPEPAVWALMLIGFGAVGASLRRRARRSGSLAANR